MLTTYYSYKNRTNEEEPLIKKPGEIDGQMFDIADCSGVTIVLMDHCEQVQIDQVKNSRIFIGACTSSIFIRNCENCVFYTCCRQLRLRDVSKCDFYIYSMSEVHIEFTSDVRFAPFNGGYPEHESHLKIAQLDTSHNLWYDIFDHNDQAKTHVNWSLISELEFENPWFPNGECERAIALTKPGSISNPSSDNNMQSFSFQQLVADAQKLADDTSAYLPAVTEDAVTISDYDIVLSLIMRFGSYKASNEIIVCFVNIYFFSFIIILISRIYFILNFQLLFLMAVLFKQVICLLLLLGISDH